MAANFPTKTLSDAGDTFTSNGTTFVWDGTTWKRPTTGGVKGETGQKGEVGQKGATGADNSTKGQKGATGADNSTKGQKGEVGQKGETGADNSTKGQKGEDNSTKGEPGASVKGEPGSTTFAVPAGGIIIWSGAANAIPSGWVLCNGSNSTPDLRGRFVVGYSNTDGDYDVGDTGGAKTDTVTISGSDTVNISVSGNTGGVQTPGGGQPYAGGSSGHTHSFSGSGSDTVNISGSDTVNTRPPYYALCYIMKT